MKHVIIGTAGHVDHGKTSLIQALTGTNTDRLKEERERGMTIDIGFAALKLPDGTVAGIVDVPGHERFLKNMLAGATGVDVVLLVIAADEGIMPQTQEHMEILRLLDVKNGVVALTKCDIADREWVDVVEEDVRLQLAGTYLAASPILRVSSATGKGIDGLKKALLSAVSRAKARNSALPARLPIDRVFTRPGFGTVVTGTLVAGSLQVGDPVQIVPQQLETRVRGLQVHGEKVRIAEAGSRVAVNIAGIDSDLIARGAQLAAPGTISPTTVVDFHYLMAPGEVPPLKHRARVRLHLGTDEIIGRAIILDDRKQLMPGEHGFVQFIGETPFAAQRGDRFVIRSYSPMHTIGGGQILAISPPKHKRSDTNVMHSLESVLRGTPKDLLQTALASSDFGITRAELQASLNLPVSDFESGLASLSESGETITIGRDRLVSAAKNRILLERAADRLDNYHAQFPLRGGMQKEELRGSIAPSADGRLFNLFVANWEAAGRLKTEGSLVRLSDFEVQLNERQIGLLARIEEFYVERGIAVPTLQEVGLIVRAPMDAISALIKVGVDKGTFVFVADGVYYASSTIESFKVILQEFLRKHESITVGEFRDLTVSNRKFALQALEYLDLIRFTLRNGDNRTLA